MQEGSREAIPFLSMTSSGFLLSFRLFSKTTDNESEKATYTGKNHVAQDTRSTQPWHTVRLSTQQFMCWRSELGLQSAGSSGRGGRMCGHWELEHLEEGCLGRPSET